MATEPAGGGQAVPNLGSLLGLYLSAETPKAAVQHAHRLCGAVEALAGEGAVARLVGFLNRC